MIASRHRNRTPPAANADKRSVPSDNYLRVLPSLQKEGRKDSGEQETSANRLERGRFRDRDGIEPEH